MELKSFKYGELTRNEETGGVNVSLLLTITTQDGSLEFEKEIWMSVELSSKQVAPIEKIIEQSIQERLKTL